MSSQNELSKWERHFIRTVVGGKDLMVEWCVVRFILIQENSQLAADALALQGYLNPSKMVQRMVPSSQLAQQGAEYLGVHQGKTSRRKTRPEVPSGSKACACSKRWTWSRRRQKTLRWLCVDRQFHTTLPHMSQSRPCLFLLFARVFPPKLEKTQANAPWWLIKSNSIYKS